MKQNGSMSQFNDPKVLITQEKHLNDIGWCKEQLVTDEDFMKRKEFGNWTDWRLGMSKIYQLM